MKPTGFLLCADYMNEVIQCTVAYFPFWHSKLKLPSQSRLAQFQASTIYSGLLWMGVELNCLSTCSRTRTALILGPYLNILYHYPQSHPVGGHTHQTETRISLVPRILLPKMVLHQTTAAMSPSQQESLFAWTKVDVCLKDMSDEEIKRLIGGNEVNIARSERPDPSSHKLTHILTARAIQDCVPHQSQPGVQSTSQESDH